MVGRVGFVGTGLVAVGDAVTVVVTVTVAGVGVVELVPVVEAGPFEGPHPASTTASAMASTTATTTAGRAGAAAGVVGWCRVVIGLPPSWTCGHQHRRRRTAGGWATGWAAGSSGGFVGRGHGDGGGRDLVGSLP